MLRARAAIGVAGILFLASYALLPGLVAARLPAPVRYWLGGAAAFAVMYGLSDFDLLQEIFLAPREIRDITKAERNVTRWTRLLARLVHEPLDQFEEDVRSGVGANEEAIFVIANSILALMKRESRGEG